MRITVVFLLLTSLAYCYLQLPLLRVPHKSKSSNPLANTTCPKEDTLAAQNSQLCYLKDISHTVQLYYNDELYAMALDLTIPISWIKSTQCRIGNTSDKCKRLEKSVGEEIRNKFHRLKNKIKQEISGQEQEEQEEQEDEDDTSTITTIGSLDKITGKFNKVQNLQFWTKDSDKLTSLYNVFLVGLFLTDQKDRMNLLSTNFINATSISSHTNKLSDGAISLRFDQDSQNSFLNEIFTYVGYSDKILTFNIGSNSSVTIGDLSVKNAENGYAGVTWVAFEEKRFPMVDVISVEQVGNQKQNSFQTAKQVILTLSASYIGLPDKEIKQFFKMLETVGKCEVGKNGFVECHDVSKHWKNNRVIFELGEAKVSFNIEELEKHKSGKTITFNIRQSQTDYIIFGQPVFHKYYVALDYRHNKIGIANKRVSFEEMVFESLTFIRLLVLVFLAGCMFLICYKPVSNLVEVFDYYREMKYDMTGIEAKRLHYSDFNDSTAYEDLNLSLRDKLSDSEIQGI